jgi:hypothetical protein
MDLDRRANDLFRPFILLQYIGVLGVLCGAASNASPRPLFKPVADGFGKAH